MLENITVGSNTKPRMILVDGTGYVYRAFYAVPPITRPDGTLVNAVYGFTNMLIRLINSDASYIVIAFDTAHKTFRHEIYPPYKGHRSPPPKELLSQLGLVHDSIQAFGTICVEQTGFEADDLIATYSCQAVTRGIEVTILSTDKDFMQLVRPGISLWNPFKHSSVGLEEVRKKFGVDPIQVVDVQALAGDSVDNVPGVPGIGVKTAAALITHFGSLDTLLSRVDEVSQPRWRQALIKYADQARLSRTLVRLKDNVPTQIQLSSLVIARQPDLKEIQSFLKEQAFHSLLARISNWPGKEESSKFVMPYISSDRMVFADDKTTIKTVAEKTYSLVKDLDDLDSWLIRARSSGIVAISSVTEYTHHSVVHLIGISLAVAPNEICYIPLGEIPLEVSRSPLAYKEKKQLQQPLSSAVTEVLKRLKREILEKRSVLKVGHNIKFELHAFHIAGQKILGEPITVTPIDDTKILSYILNGATTDHSINSLANTYLDLSVDIDGITLRDDGRVRTTADRIAQDRVLDCIAESVGIIFRLYLLLRDSLLVKRMVTVHETLDRPLVPVLAAMERTGILVDSAGLDTLSKDFGTRMCTLETEIYNLVGGSFNLASSKQVGQILFDRMGFTSSRKSRKRKTYVTDAAVLESLAAQGHILPARVLEWRQLAKLKSTYADILIARRNEWTGRVYTFFAQTKTATGRLSSNNPNLQNVPVRTEDGLRVRRAFIASPGYRLLSADYSQIELRLLTHIANVTILKRAFNEGIDIHAVTASKIFDVPLAAVNQQLRRKAKAVNFGVIYGISPFGLATQLGLPKNKARTFIENYFRFYPEIHSYIEAAKIHARQHGFVTTLFGRKCQILGIGSRDVNTRNYAERSAINAPIQGGAADIIKLAMTRLSVSLIKAGLETNLLLQVHDELIFEVPDSEVAAAIVLIRSIMENVINLSVPLVVEIGTGCNWAEAHS